MSRTHLAVVALAAASLLSACSFYGRAYGGYSQTQLSGDLGLGVAGTSVTANGDVERDLGLDDSASPYGRVELGAGLVSLNASAFRYSSSGVGALTANFGSIPAGLPVATDVDLVNAKGSLVFNIVDTPVLRVAPGVAVDYFDIDIDVRSLTVAAFEQIHVQAPVPLVFLQAELDLGNVGVVVEAGGIDIDLQDAAGTVFDLEGMLKIAVIDHVELMGGYRWISLDVDGDADGQPFVADLDLRGWFVGGGVTF